jgi:hypothetical protein
MDIVVLSSCVYGTGVWCCQHSKLIYVTITSQTSTQIRTISRSVADVCNSVQIVIN